MFAGIVIGCGPSPKEAGPATPKQAAPKANVSGDPQAAPEVNAPDNPQVARILPLLDDYAKALKAAAGDKDKIQGTWTNSIGMELRRS
jgi:hypothetical protein